MNKQNVLTAIVRIANEAPQEFPLFPLINDLCNVIGGMTVETPPPPQNWPVTATEIEIANRLGIVRPKRKYKKREKTGDALDSALATPYFKKWSRNFDSCIICGTTENKHAGKGRCSVCYFKKDGDIVHDETLKDTVQKRDKNMKNETGQAFCQNPECTNTNNDGTKKLFWKGVMKKYDDLLFCRKSCLDEFRGPAVS